MRQAWRHHPHLSNGARSVAGAFLRNLTDRAGVGNLVWLQVGAGGGKSTVSPALAVKHFKAQGNKGTLPRHHFTKPNDLATQGGMRAVHTPAYQLFEGAPSKLAKHFSRLGPLGTLGLKFVEEAGGTRLLAEPLKMLDVRRAR
eukprot:jgi/Tetstr1/466110/TSEL_000938.t1